MNDDLVEHSSVVITLIYIFTMLKVTMTIIVLVLNTNLSTTKGYNH